MNYRKLGNSGLFISEIGLGGWLTHGRSINDETTDDIVKTAYDAGINFYDTADIYNKGEAEKSLAKAIKGLRREDLVIATKCFWPMSDNVNNKGLSRKHIVESVNGSLVRLGLDYIDLYQFHRYDPETPFHEMVRAVDDLIRQGKILYWGVSCWSAAQITSAVSTSKELNCCPPISNQPPYNLFQREIETDVIPVSQQQGLSQVVFSPLAQGVLTGKYKPGEQPPSGSRGADETSNQFMQWLMTDRNLAAVQEIAKLAQSTGLTVGQFALAWCLRSKNVASVIVGATSSAQLEANIGASGALVDSALFDKAEAIISGELTPIG